MMAVGEKNLEEKAGTCKTSWIAWLRWEESRLHDDKFLATRSIVPLWAINLSWHGLYDKLTCGCG